MIIDMHCDTISEIRHRRAKGEDCCLRENALHIDAGRLAAGGYLLQCFALYVNLRGCGGIDKRGRCSRIRLGPICWNCMGFIVVNWSRMQMCCKVCAALRS